MGIPRRTRRLRRRVRDVRGAEPIRQAEDVLGRCAAPVQKDGDEPRVFGEGPARNTG